MIGSCPGVAHSPHRRCPMIAISSHPTVRPENGGRPAAKLLLFPKLKIAQTAAKSHIFAFFHAFLVRRKTGRKMHGFAAVSRKMCGFGRYAAVPDAIGEHGRD